VPPGFAVSTAAFSAFLAEAKLEPVVASALEGAAPGDVNAVGAASSAIAEAMRAAPVPDAVRDEVTRRYAELSEAAGDPEPPVAVRSSALGEDSHEATFAGQQETYLWVRGAGDVCDALRDCWVSLYSPTAISYRAGLGEAAHAPAMGVAVQLMVDAEVSGVMFTCNPVSGDPSMVAVNAAWGLGLAVVGGEVTPDDYLVSKVTREVVREQLNPKRVEYVPHPGGHGAERREVPAERSDAACLTADTLALLVDVGRRVEDYFGSHQDIEWAIARGSALPEGLFVVQSRPVTVTKTAPKQRERPSAIELVMGTFGAWPEKR
jgi:pyruvate,water dikinase